MSKLTRNRISLLLIDNLIWIILAGIYLSFAVILPSFRNPIFLFKIIYFSIPLGFIILAEATCLIAGVFDISVGQLTGLVTMLSAVLIVDTGYFAGVPSFLLVLLPLALGLGFGALNGFLVGKLKLNPFLATLGTYLIFYGAKLQTTGASTVAGLPEAYLLGGDSTSTILLFLAVFVVLYFIITRTRFGHHVYSIGGNSNTSEMLGVNKSKIYFLVYLISGILCGFAALTYTGFVSAASPTVASDTVFMAFAGAILAGVSINGGRGSMFNVVGGILLITVIAAGLTMLSVSVYWRQVLFGVLVIVAIIVNKSREKLRDRILLPR
ncbi:MAG: ABC transporter permease [Candidatus Bathyarchaeota archaeon]|nr:ABC transporter permease [Candidatus Bathyarchaeota archaeon]